MEPNFCRCDCGEIAPEGKQYVRYHHNRDPQKRAKNSKNVMGNKNHFFGKTHSPKTKQLISDANTGRLVGEKSPHYGKHPSDETRRLIGKKTKERWEDEDYRNNLIEKFIIVQTGRKHSPETRRKMSENHADISGEKNPMFGKRGIGTSMYGRRGEKAPNWQGGVSKLPYCPIWSPWLKEEIKERDGFECQNPDCNKEITKNNSLGVHHIDYDKKNCSVDNLITLCKSCNSKANHNRTYWEKFYNSLNFRFQKQK